MNRFVLRAMGALLLVRALPALAGPAEDLHALFEAEWQRGLREDPVLASYLGDRRYNDRLQDLSAEAIAARQQADRDALAKLDAIDRAALSDEDKLNYDTFRWQLEHQIARQKFREYLIPMEHRGGLQTFEELTEFLPLVTVKDYEDWIARIGQLDRAVDQTIALMREGIAQGIVPARVTMQRIPDQIDAQVVESAEHSPLYAAFRDFPDGIGMADRERLRGEARRVIAQKAIPAYEKLSAFFEDTYLPATRDTIAAAELPNGREYYEFLAGYYTTTDLTPDQIHDVGLKEVARIRGEMEKIRAEVGFEGDLAAFFEHLRTDPTFYYATPDDLLTAYRALTRRIDPELVKVFRVLPRMPYGVRPIPDNTAPDTTTAYYQPGAPDGSRAGFYYVNLYKPDSRPKWEMMALSLHEAVPGHHFQFAFGLEQPDRPMFRRVAYFVAYGEGWGLYAEGLGYPMGLYDDPYDRFGQLAYEIWRAVRLVVDTGMHHKGWTRQRAIDYFKNNTPTTEQNIVNEIDRYISTPGQALAYKIGQLRIVELRDRAAAALGDAFDLRDFHHEVLSTGSVPLSALEQHIDAWIARRKNAASAK